MKAFRVAEANLCVYLHPSESKNILQALRQQLSSLILKYDDRFNGVVLAHYDTKIQNKTARLMGSLTPYFGVRLRTKLLLFSPKPGMLLGKLSRATH
ncbi:DNA-directed RNA polymerase I subunit [Nymphaea thermarum]|nr:DNA-directed RNA polymerase I subunit [Nymphaea thermarum]